MQRGVSEMLEGGHGLRNGQAMAVEQAADTLASRIHRALAAEIAAGRLAPGSRLDEQEVAVRFGASRTPVREAFRALAAEQLVVLGGRQGAVVRSIGVHALIEMFQVMAELEGLCARLAARRVSAARVAALREAHAALVACAEAGPDAFYDANQVFHEIIYEASCNGFLAGQTRALRNRVAAYRRRVTRMPGRVAATIREHEAVLAAIAAGEAEAAHAAMRAHVSLLGDDLLDFIAGFG